MKIAILTLPLHTNYGGILQAYSLQTVLERLGHNVTVIGESNDKKYNLAWHPYCLLKRLIKKFVLRRIPTIFLERYEKPIAQNTKRFVDKYINVKRVNSVKDLEENDYDVIVVGSDQIWRPYYLIGHVTEIKDAFLDFAFNWNIKRIAYAPSFGVDNWEYNDYETDICKKLIQKFLAVSVREQSGVELCKTYLNVDAEHVLDPTLLLNKEDFIKLIKNSNIDKSEGDLFYYILHKNEYLENLISAMANEKGLYPFTVHAKAEDQAAPLEERIQKPVEMWLRGFYDAKIIITDSFHGCVFSLIFNKPFLVKYNKVRGVARVNSLLKLFNQEYRIIPELTKLSDIDERVYGNPNVEELLKGLKEKSLDFLIKGLS